MSEVQYAKCQVGKYCNSLRDRIQESNSRQKGIVPINIITLTSHEITHVGLCYKQSSKDKGLMLNYCPFCGQKIIDTKKWSKTK